MWHSIGAQLENLRERADDNSHTPANERAFKAAYREAKKSLRFKRSIGAAVAFLCLLLPVAVVVFALMGQIKPAPIFGAVFGVMILLPQMVGLSRAAHRELRTIEVTYVAKLLTGVTVQDIKDMERIAL